MASINNHEERIKLIENNLMSITQYDKTLTVEAGVWTDTEIRLSTGTYVIKVEVQSSGFGGSQWHETYSCVASLYNEGTNSTVVTEIPLTSAGHASNTRFIVLGFKRYPNTNSGKSCLAISANENFNNCLIKFALRKVL